MTRDIEERLSEEVGLFFFVRGDHFTILVDRFATGVVGRVMLDGLDAVSKVTVTLKQGQIMRAVVDDSRLIQRTSAYQAVMFESRSDAPATAPYANGGARQTLSDGYQKVLGLTLAPLVGADRPDLAHLASPLSFRRQITYRGGVEQLGGVKMRSLKDLSTPKSFDRPRVRRYVMNPRFLR